MLGELFTHCSSEAIEQASASILVGAFGNLPPHDVPSHFVENDRLSLVGRFEHLTEETLAIGLPSTPNSVAYR
jgi:hypothetical protein